jgi:alpha-1,2-mannosyltransferase
MVPGVALLVSYNGLLFGTWGPSNGHELGGSVGVHWSDLPVNIGGALVSPTRGLLVFYPVLLLALPTLRSAIRAARPWQLAAAIGGTAGLLVQLALNRYSGGDTFFGPRLMIEPLVLWAPLLALAVYKFSVDHPRSVLLPAALGAGVIVHGAAAILLPY